MNNNQLAQLWSQIAPDFDQTGPPFFAQSGRRLVELAQIKTDDFVLDVAMGRGAILFPAAEKIGRNGRIIGIDLAAGMLQNTKADARIAQQPISLTQMEAEHLALAAATCDVVLCGHAIFYFPQALTEFSRVLKPGGQIGISIIAEGTFDWLWHLFAPFMPREEMPTEAEPAINTPEGLHQRLLQAQFEQIQISEETAVLVFNDEEAWWAFLMVLGTRQIIEKMSLADRMTFKKSLFQKLHDFKEFHGVHIPVRTLFTLAAKQETKSNG